MHFNSKKTLNPLPIMQYVKFDLNMCGKKKRLLIKKMLNL